VPYVGIKCGWVVGEMWRVVDQNNIKIMARTSGLLRRPAAAGAPNTSVAQRNVSIGGDAIPFFHLLGGSRNLPHRWSMVDPWLHT
jgi:hypothetical protein